MKFFGLARSVLYRMSVKHPIGTPGGFSRQDEDGVHLVSKPGLAAHLKRHPPRKRRPKER
jgi:hypothetical protein